VEEEVEGVVTGARPEEGVEVSVMLTKKANAQEEVLVDFLIKNFHIAGNSMTLRLALVSVRHALECD
jgi:hypothetical protein